jgi:hypothetical protein
VPVINTQTIPVASGADAGVNTDDLTYYMWFYDLAGGKTEYVITIACMIVQDEGGEGGDKPGAVRPREAVHGNAQVGRDPPDGGVL